MKISKVLNIVKIILFCISFTFIMIQNLDTMSIGFTMLQILIPWTIIEYLVRVSMLVDKKVKRLEDEEKK